MKNKFDFILKLNQLFDRKEKINFLGVLFISLLMAIFQAIGVASILPFINMVMNPNIVHESTQLNYIYVLFNFESTESFLIFFGFLVLALLIVGNIISAVATWLKINFVWKKNHKLSTALLRKYLSMPYTYFLDQNTSDLGKNILAEVQQLSSSFLLPIIKIITDSFIILIILLLLLFVNPTITLIAFAILLISYFLIYFKYANKLKSKGIERIEKNRERYKSSSEALGGIKDIKILGVEDFFLDRFFVSSEKYSGLQSWYQIIGQIPRYIMEIVAFGGIIGLLIFLILTNIPTHEVIPILSFFAFAGYRLLPAFQEVFSSLAIFKFNKAILDKIHKDMVEGWLEKEDTKLNKIKIKPILFENKIRLEHIYFSYPGNFRETLIDINIEIKKNSFVALIGTTGSGKTTLVDLILGLLIPQEGKFLVDNVKVASENIKNWQVNLGYVPQQIYLSDDTIARNIAFGLPDNMINMEQIKKVSKMANIHDFIDEELPKGYHTVIGERGIRLSGGQRQRIGIARALYHDPQVLIFDEATSSLDNETEKEVLKAIEDVSRLKTMIVIAHRLTTVKNADVVYLIEKGKITKKGSYSEMIQGSAEPK